MLFIIQRNNIPLLHTDTQTSLHQITASSEHLSPFFMVLSFSFCRIEVRPQQQPESALTCNHNVPSPGVMLCSTSQTLQSNPNKSELDTTENLPLPPSFWNFSLPTCRSVRYFNLPSSQSPHSGGYCTAEPPWAEPPPHPAWLPGRPSTSVTSAVHLLLQHTSPATLTFIFKCNR